MALRPAAAQEAARAVGLDEVVVTAQKREQTAQDVGISIGVVQAADLQRTNINTSTDIIDRVANVAADVPYGPGVSAHFSIRGVAQNDINDATESPVAIHIDNVYVVPTSAGSFPLYDLDRVEILRGPQGTLFGRNSTAGVINFLSARPRSTFGAAVTAEYESYDERAANGFVNIPVSSTLAVRASANYHDGGAWEKNVLGLTPASGQTRTGGGRLQALFTPSENIDELVRISYDHVDGQSWNYIHGVSTVDPVSGTTYPVFTPGAVDQYGDPARTGPANGQPNKLRYSDLLLASNDLEWRIDKLALTSITAFVTNGFQRQEDCDAGPQPICQTDGRFRSHQFSEELRAYFDGGSYRLTSGLYYLHQTAVGNDMAALFLQPGGAALNDRSDFTQKVDGIALFGNAEYDFSPQWTLSGGLRLSHDEKELDQTSGIYNGCPPGDPTAFNAFFTGQLFFPKCGTIAETVFNRDTYPDLYKEKKNDYSAKIALNYKPADGFLAYASWARGVKAPGFNNGIVGALPGNLMPYKGEVVYVEELGIKTEFFDKRVRFNATGFYYDYHDYQSQAVLGLSTVISNHAANLHGAETDITVVPANGWTLQVSGGYLETVVHGVPNSLSILGDREMVLAPRWNAQGLLRYEFPVLDGALIGLQASTTARASEYVTAYNDQVARLGGNAVGNLRIDFNSANRKYDVAFFVNNFADARYPMSAANTYGLNHGYYYQLARPRWFGGQVTIHFD
jgi:outer membrane receptor protein involved in Fe transport